ncbi:hypothetical protein N7507_002304 [Penicillium longicatenatum]|nr:hypothetical protein N7507_002304 [Penicillium longicatenatum]
MAPLHRIIVGVDYGTTFTGVSYVDSLKHTIHDINVIRTWPGPSREQDETWKTPSRIAYGTENPLIDGATIKWGYMVVPKMKSYTWTKLLLSPETSHPQRSQENVDILEGDGLMRIPDFKQGAQDVCADYLRGIYEHIIFFLEQRLTPEIIKVTALDFWFTVPAIWSDKAKHDTYLAVTAAGFGSRPGDLISMITEPEAAAVATLSSLSEDERGLAIKNGDGIIICDCGGGTVDIVTYKVIQVKPDLRFEELLVGTGDKCGSTYIDREFLKWMSRTFGSAFDKVSFEKRGPGSRFMKDFEGLKRDFGASNQLDLFEVDLPMPGVSDPEHYDSENCTKLSLTLSSSDMESFFKPVTQKIEDLLEDQLRQVRQTSESYINKIVLVGGFGDSPYLNTTLRAWCQRRGGISLFCPENPQASVVKGAALRGLNGMKPEKRKCRLHYGFKINKNFRESIDPQWRSVPAEWDGRKLCSDRMVWLIAKGKAMGKEDSIPYDVSRVHYPGDTLDFAIDLYTCEEDSAPDWYYAESCRKAGEIQYSFSKRDLSKFEKKKNKELGKKMINLEYKIQVEMFAEKVEPPGFLAQILLL